MGKITDSVSRLFETKNLKSQIQTQLLISIMPFMASYTAFFYFWVFLDWDTLQALTPTSIMFSIGTVLYVMYSHSIREEGVSLGYGPCNMTLRWSSSLVTEESNVIVAHTSLYEKEDEEPMQKIKNLRMKIPKAEPAQYIKPKPQDKVYKVYVYKSRVHNIGIFFASFGILVGIFSLLIFWLDLTYGARDYYQILFRTRRAEDVGLGLLLTKLGFGEEASLKLIDYVVSSVIFLFVGWIISFVSRKSITKLEELKEEDRKNVKVKNPGSEQFIQQFPMTAQEIARGEARRTKERIPEELLTGELLIGKFFSLCVFYREMESPLYGEDKPFRMIAFIHDYPFDNVFRKIPGQLVSYKGLVYETAAVKIDSTFSFWDEELEPCPIFRVTSDPEQTRLIQIGLGIKPTAERTDVEQVSAIRSAHQAIKFAMRLKNVQSAYKETVEGYRDSREEGVSMVDRLLDNREIIRKRKRLLTLTKRRAILFLIAGIIGTIVILWLLGVIK